MRRYQQSKHALGSEAYLTLVVDDESLVDQLFAYLWRMIGDFEDRFSRFRESSELSSFNKKAGTPMDVSAEFHDLLLAAKTMAAETGDLYNPLILPALQQAGYKGSWPNASSVVSSLNYEDRSVAEAKAIELTDKMATIPRDTALDFGGIGKGYLLDLLAKELSRKGVGNYWLSLGGDILCNGFDETNEPWRIIIQDAHDLAASVGSVGSGGGRLAVATSGITKRKGIGWHHIIDPRTLRPAETDVLTATICAESATEADVFAKCLVILGGEAARPFMHVHQLANALIQTNAEKYTTLKIGDVWSSSYKQA